MSKSRFLTYYEKTVRPVLIGQYNYLKSVDVPEIRFVRVGFSFTNLISDEDWRLLKSLEFLEVITGRKAGINDLYWSSAGGRERRMVGSSCVTLRNTAAYNFLEYLVHVVLPLNHRRYGFLDVKVSNAGVYNFVLEDLGVFFRQNENLIGFDGKLIISIGTTGRTIGETESLLRCLGVIIK